MFLIMGLCAGSAAIGLLIGAGWAYFSQQRKMAGRLKAVGTVVELSGQSTANSSMLCPVVEFTAASGQTVRFTSEFGSRPASHRVGQSVNLRYEAADPQKAEIESAMSQWLVPLILIFIGLVACCLALSFLAVYGLGGPNSV